MLPHLDVVSPLKHQSIIKGAISNTTLIILTVKFLNRLVCLEEICVLDFSDHPHPRWCFTQRWGSAALLSALRISLLQGSGELISSFYSLNASASVFFLH